MATFCDIPNCDQLSFRTDKLTRKHYCRNHYRYYSTDLSKLSITQKAIQRHKAEKIANQLTEDEIFNTEIKYLTPTPECYDGKETGRILTDEFGQWSTENGVDESLVNLSNDLDYVLSLYIRYKYSDSAGMVKCFTCPKVLPIKEIQNGHYVKRSHKATRHLYSNCRPQCPECNNDHNYDETPYTNALEAEQPGLAEQLKELGKQTYKATRDELKQQLIELRSHLEILKLKIVPNASKE